MNLLAVLLIASAHAQLFPDAFSPIDPAAVDQLTATLSNYFESIYAQPEASSINDELYTATGSIGAAYSAGDPADNLGVGLLTALLEASATPTWFSVLPTDIQSWLLSVDGGLDTIFQEFESMTGVAGGAAGGGGDTSPTTTGGPSAMSTLMSSGGSSDQTSTSPAPSSAGMITSPPSMSTVTGPSSSMSASLASTSTMSAAGMGRRFEGFWMTLVLATQIWLGLNVWMT